ncbi:unnamed protein product, partial [Staurois parvus]
MGHYSSPHRHQRWDTISPPPTDTNDGALFPPLTPTNDGA